MVLAVAYNCVAMTAAEKRVDSLKSHKDKILIVDDERMIRWSLGEALRGWGFEPIEAETVAA